MKPEIEYLWYPGTWVAVNPKYLKDCAELYSAHYGVWGNSDSRSGKRVRLNEDGIKKYMITNAAHVALAYRGDQLLGYAVVIQANIQDLGATSWVTQLVVHRDFRKIGIAKQLLSIWGFSDNEAWGIVTANPYAVRALEKTTRRRCDPLWIQDNYKRLIAFGAKHITYIRPDISASVGPEGSKIDTEFPVDHSQLTEMLEAVTDRGKEWSLGLIEEGWEWFAFTFRKQAQFSWSRKELDELFTASDQIVKQAYSRMSLDQNHSWMSHTPEEIDLLIEWCELSADKFVIDFGCGNGRHCLELARRGIRVIGVDYLKTLIEQARDVTRKENLSIAEFTEDDVRHASLDLQADAVVCLYDVVGTYADNEDNINILKNIVRHLKPGGKALISVMNYELTERNATRWFSLNKDPNKLSELPPSLTMEGSGKVFNPDFYMIDQDTRIVYRREQFIQGKSLPIELIVRDRRFRRDEIVKMCQDVGFSVIWSKYVKAGWIEVPGDSNKAFEILLLCEKPRLELFTLE